MISFWFFTPSENHNQETTFYKSEIIAEPIKWVKMCLYWCVSAVQHIDGASGLGPDLFAYYDGSVKDVYSSEL